MTDGNTIRVLANSRTVKVRSAEIGTSESRQPYGLRVKQVLSGLIFGRTVRVD